MPMKRFPELRPRPWDGAVILCVILLAVLCGARAGGTERLEAVVSIDGTVAERFVLEGGSQHIYHHNGYTLRLVEEDGGLCVAEADCPTQDCVHTGVIRRSGQSIICLPARISVELVGGGEGGVDAVIG